ncbi:MAG: MogA/MoaB family molybdenum cofactor biosynthesis protein [Nocardioides sp.]
MKPGPVREPGLRAGVVIASTRASAGIYLDATGPVITEFLTDLGFGVEPVAVVPDGHPVGVAIDALVRQGVRCVLTSGGTGLTPTDRTPEMTTALLDREIPGIAEAIRAAGIASGVPAAALSRGVAGVAGQCLVVNLPGSTGGVRDGLRVLGPILVHAIEQIVGSDHPRTHR